jgi:hypothetical protein
MYIYVHIYEYICMCIYVCMYIYRLTKAVKEMNLIDDMDLLEVPEYTSQSVKAVDDRGAEIAKKHSRVLAAAVGEAFYAVHSKAQRRVPVPEGLDLVTPFNSEALDHLLQQGMPENLTLANLSFSINVPVVVEQHVDTEEEIRVQKLTSSLLPNDLKLQGIYTYIYMYIFIYI